MAYISQITLPSGTTYDLKDTWARTQIEAITGGSAVVFKGVSSTPLTDGGNQNPTVDGTPVTTKSTGELYFYEQEEFIYGDDSKWHSLGPQLQNLGALAYKDSASGSYTPSGTVSQPTFTGGSSTVTITATNNASGNYTPSGTISGGTFTGSKSTFTGDYTPAGTVSQPTFTGESLTSTGNFTPAGSVSLTNGNKTAAVKTASSGTTTYTPGGTVSTPTISVTTAGTTAQIKQVSGVTNMVSALATAAPGATAPANAITYYSVADENLSLYQIGATKAAPCSTANVTVKTGDASYSSSAPTFSGTGVRLVTDNISVPTSASFSGTQGSVSVSGTPSGTVSQPTFTGEEGTVSTSGTPNGSVSNLSFSGQKVQLAGTTTAAGTVSQPTFTGEAKTVTVS